MAKITLDTPILVNGKEVREFAYDAKKITGAQFIQAATMATANEVNKTMSIKARENDYALHFFLGCFAIINENPGVDIEDLKRVSGYDVLDIADIGLLFTVRRLEATSAAKPSADSTENTPDTSM